MCLLIPVFPSHSDIIWLINRVSAGNIFTVLTSTLQQVCIGLIYVPDTILGTNNFTNKTRNVWEMAQLKKKPLAMQVQGYKFGS